MEVYKRSMSIPPAQEDAMHENKKILKLLEGLGYGEEEEGK